jgi:hypothetical protein
MGTSFLPDPSAICTAVGKLFDEKPPALAEVRFPKMGASSDWFLCEDAAALDAIIDRLGRGAEVHLNSVWDLKNSAGAVVIPKSKLASFQPDADTSWAVVGRLFDEKAPALVEVRFPKMGASSDWFLCEDAAALDAVLDRTGLGAEAQLNSVWDLKNPAGAVVIQKGKHQRSSPLKRYKLPPGHAARQAGSVAPPAGGQAKRPLEYMEC